MRIRSWRSSGWLALAVTACATGGSPGGGAEADPGATPALLPEPGTETRPTGDRAHVDVHRYHLAIDLTDPASGEFRGDAWLALTLAAGSEFIELDYAGPPIATVHMGPEEAPFTREGPILRVGPLEPAPAARDLRIRVRYGGVPQNGLFFGEDVNGDPAVFADNWPNRARWWFPSNDHPSDKATARFEITVPEGFAAIANGRHVETREAPDGVTWVWETHPDAPIPTYTMVLGMARFEDRVLGEAACGRAPAVTDGECVPVSVWALAGDGEYGVERFSRAPDMLDYYTGLVGAYPYEKLAHVESSTRFGGMENSSAIFYARAGWAERRMGEGVIAHETAHQWFGDAVTPASWYHLWVSEGLASYFGPLYFRARDGEAAFRDRMEAARETMLGSDVIGQAIVDSSTNDLFSLLNANNYQKGAWVLHMLRGRVGDEPFFRGIRAYFEGHRHGLGDTEGLRHALEEASGASLEAFFEQWVRSPGVPYLEAEWWQEGDDLYLSVAQVQPREWPTFELRTDVEILRADGYRIRRAIELSEREQTVRLGGDGGARELVLDPDGWLLARIDLRRRTAR